MDAFPLRYFLYILRSGQRRPNNEILFYLRTRRSTDLDKKGKYKRIDLLNECYDLLVNDCDVSFKYLAQRLLSNLFAFVQSCHATRSKMYQSMK